MSGHSKWATIKRKKGKADAERGKAFSKITKEITVAARSGGGDVSSNPILRQIVEKAKSINMPLANIEKAIKKGTGELPGTVYEEVTYEGYGPGGAAIFLESLTDNRNRTVAEIRHIFSKWHVSVVKPIVCKIGTCNNNSLSIHQVAQHAGCFFNRFLRAPARYNGHKPEVFPLILRQRQLYLDAVLIFMGLWNVYKYRMLCELVYKLDIQSCFP